MANQQVANIALYLNGDGVSTTFTYSITQLFEAQSLDSSNFINPTTLPSAVALVGGTLAAGSTASLDGFGNLTITAASAFSGSGTAELALYFNSGTLQGTTQAWTSATAVNTTWTLANNGNKSMTVGFIISGSVTGGVIVFQVSQDGVNWFPIQGCIANGFTALTGWTFGVGSQAIQFDVSGYAWFRLQLTSVIVGSGTVTFIMQETGSSIEPTVVVGQSIASSHQVQDNAIYNSSAPAPVSGSTVQMQADGFGNLFVNDIRRSQVLAETGNIASTTPATIVAGLGAGIFTDLAGLVLTLREGATANIFFGVNISDGTKTYRFNFMSQSVTTFQSASPINLNFNPPLPATTANTAWTIALTSATDTPSVDYIMTFIKQLAE